MSAKSLVIDSYRRAEKAPGGPSRPAWLHVNDGARETGASVLVDHSDLEFAATVADAEVLPDASRQIADARRAQAAAEEEAGFGLRYSSLTDLWRAHPELRPVRWGGGDLIVDATIAVRSDAGNEAQS